MKYGNISLTGNYKYYHFYKCMLSQPAKFIGTQIVFLFGMLLYYIFCAKYQHPLPITATVIFHLLTVFVMIVIAFKDPGIVAKVLPHYETP